MARDNQARILQAALSVFSQQGFQRARLEEIARAAGVAKGTLYYNFEDKGRLFAAAVAEGAEALVRGGQAVRDSGEPFLEHLRVLVDTITRPYIRHRDLALIWLREGVGEATGEATRVARGARERVVGFLADLLVEGQALGYVRPGDPRLSALALIGMLDALCDEHLRAPRDVSAEQVVDRVYEIVRGGLAGPRAKG